MKRFVASVIAAAFAAALLVAPASATDSASQKLLSKLEWRSIGPFIGGRVVAVTGVPDQPHLFYMGAVQGGVWRSTNDGMSWQNISDGKLSKLADGIGALAVAPSNSKIIYAGTGESDIRGDYANGDGVYKSMDAGKTWHYAGLRETRNTSALVVDPRDPNVAYASSMGSVFSPNADRGVFKTTDGGKTWKKVLFVDDNTGGNIVVMDKKNPNVLYASMWQAQRTPFYMSSGGPGSGLYKTSDGGARWTKISSNPGFATGTLGKMGIAVSASDPRVVYAIVQARDGGVFRSNDGGASWKRVNSEMKLRQRAFYYMAIYVDPTNANVAYAPEVDSVYKTTDGGKTWKVQPTIPHGDNHIIWINPRNPKTMIVGNDGGATVSIDGGASWSSDHNQPTGQFYHIVLDDQFPYHVYGAQQDEGSFEGPSATNENFDVGAWHSVALGESTYIAVDPNDPRTTYGAGYNSSFVQLSYATGEEKDISPVPYYQAGASAAEQQYRFGWTHPVMFSPAEPHALFETAQVVFRSDDFGQTWRIISPDLTRNLPSEERQTGGPVDLDQTGVETGPDIASFNISPLNGQVMWAGSADGLVHVTLDGGANWKAVTPPALPQTAQISSIEPSYTDKGTAFVTASRYLWNDFRPYVYKTTDFGAHWTSMTNGLPSDQTVYAVREDPREPRVLLAGTRSTVYVSLDGGARWQSLALNLPVVQVRDLQINARQGQVALGTHGRSFWILDNLALLEDLARQSSFEDSTAQLFAPETAWLTHAYGNGPFGGGGDVGQNPDFGATIYFNVPKTYNGRTPFTLSFQDPSGNTIRTFTMHPKNKKEKELSFEDIVSMDAVTLTQRELSKDTGVEPGMNAFQWDLRYPEGTEINGIRNDYTDDYQDAMNGPSIVPGYYTVVMNYNGKVTKQTLKVQLDPRLHPGPDALQKRLDLAMKISNELSTFNSTVNAALAARPRLSAAKQAQLTQELESVVQFKTDSSEYNLLHESKLRNHLAFLMNALDLAYQAPTPAEEQTFVELKAKADDAISKMKSIAGI